MKRGNFSSNKERAMNKAVIGLSTACVAAALSGYWLARQTSVPAGIAGEVRSGLARPATAPEDNSAGRTDESAVKDRSAAQLLAMKEDLRERFIHSPEANHDWEWRQQTAAILATMSPQELGGFAKELLIRDSSGNLLTTPYSHNPLFNEIVRQWALKDPLGACQTLGEVHRPSMIEAFGQWQQRDPAAAQAWLESARFSKENDELKAQLQQNLLSLEVTDDFAAARESLEKMSPDAQKRCLEEWSKLVAYDPDKRAELLALLAGRGDAELADKCYRKMIAEMADKSPNAAANFIESTNLSEEQKNKLNDQVVADWAMKDPVQAFAKWAELAREDVPAALIPALGQWSMNSPGAEQAQEWVKKLPPGAASDQFKLGLIRRWTNFRYEQQLDVLATLTDSTQRIRELKQLKRKLGSGHPDEVNAFFEKLPQADRDAMEKPLE
jgi:hypothetical protein